MSVLAAALRYDHLRIAIPAGDAGPELINEMQAEFVQFLEAAVGCDVVIVDLPNAGQLPVELKQMLQTWQRISALAGRKFRVNGISRAVHQVLSRSETAISSRGPLFARKQFAFAERS